MTVPCVCQASIQQQQQSIQELQAEIGTGLMAQLSPAEQDSLASLNPRVQALEVRLSCAYPPMLAMGHLMLWAACCLLHIPG